jgi:MFS family permease
MKLSDKYLMMMVVLLGTFMAVLDGTVVNIALPTITSYFHVNMDATQWIGTVYITAEVLLLIVFARAASQVGKARMFKIGFGIFILSSLACGLSNSLPMLIACRAVQGIGASMAFAVNYALMYEIFPANERGKSMGFIGSVVAVAGLVGPALGGYIVQVLGWRYIFFINVPIGILLILGAIKFLHPSEIKEDYSGQPLIDLSIFKDRNFTLANVGMLLFFIASFTITILMPFYLELVMGYTPAMVGTFFLIVPAITFLGAPVSGNLYDKYGWKYQAAMGTLLQAVGMLLMVFATRAWSIVLICIAYALTGCGTALFQAPNSTEIMNSIPVTRLSSSSALMSTLRNLGMVIGLAMGSNLLVFQMDLAHIAGTVMDLAPQTLAVFVSNGMIYGSLLSILGAVVCIYRNIIKNVVVG